MSTTIRFTGGAQLQRNLDLLSTRMSRKVQQQALVEAAEPLRTTMAQLAPRAPGAPDLADHIVIGTARLPQQVAVSVGPAKGFFYGFFLEYGTARQRPQAFMRPAFDRHVASGLTLKVIMGSLWRALIARGFGSARTSGGGTGV